MTRKSTDQYENDIERLEERANLVVGSMMNATGVNVASVLEAQRYMDHMILYLRHSIR